MLNSNLAYQYVSKKVKSTVKTKSFRLKRLNKLLYNVDKGRFNVEVENVEANLCENLRYKIILLRILVNRNIKCL